MKWVYGIIIVSFCFSFHWVILFGRGLASIYYSCGEISFWRTQTVNILSLGQCNFWATVLIASRGTVQNVIVMAKKNPKLYAFSHYNPYLKPKDNHNVCCTTLVCNYTSLGFACQDSRHAPLLFSRIWDKPSFSIITKEAKRK